MELSGLEGESSGAAAKIAAAAMATQAQSRKLRLVMPETSKPQMISVGKGHI